MYQSPQGDFPIILAVSDGHGDKRSFRSRQGAQLAVKKMVETLREYLLRLQREELTLAEIEESVSNWLPRELVRRWRQAVLADIDRDPFTTDESKKLPAMERGAPADRYLVYGTTALAAAIDKGVIQGQEMIYMILLQIGDGDILITDKDCLIIHPLPSDARLFAQETTSLSAADAHKDFRARFLPLTDLQPALILLSSDGYSNSFENITGFEEIGADYFWMIRTEGLAVVEAHLEEWLEETTREGSGDDITLGMIYNLEMIGSEVP